MLVPIVAAVVGLAVVLVAVYADAGLPDRSGPVASWPAPPHPRRLTDVEFPVRARGYDIGAVERYLAELHAAYATLWREAERGDGERHSRGGAQRGEAVQPAPGGESRKEESA